MIHFFGNPVEAEKYGFNPTMDIRIGPPMPAALANERIRERMANIGHLPSEEDLKMMEERDASIMEAWEAIKR